MFLPRDQKDLFMRSSIAIDASLTSRAKSAGEHSLGGVIWPGCVVEWVQRAGGTVNAVVKFMKAGLLSKAFQML